jgi:hypothetical protein
MQMAFLEVLRDSLEALEVGNTEGLQERFYI